MQRAVVTLTPIETPRVIDFQVIEHGSVWAFTPLTDDARAWWNEHVDPDALQIAGSYAVEHRYAPDIAQAIIAEGFETYPPARRS